MRSDYMERIRERGATILPLEIQIRRARYFRGRYNGKLFERLADILIERHEPMPRLLVSGWGGSGDVIDHGVAMSRYRDQRHVYRLERGRYWVRGQDGKQKNFEPRPVQVDVDLDALRRDVMAQTSKSRAYLAKN